MINKFLIHLEGPTDISQTISENISIFLVQIVHRLSTQISLFKSSQQNNHVWNKYLNLSTKQGTNLSIFVYEIILINSFFVHHFFIVMMFFN